MINASLQQMIAKVFYCAMVVLIVFFYS